MANGDEKQETLIQYIKPVIGVLLLILSGAVSWLINIVYTLDKTATVNEARIELIVVEFEQDVDALEAHIRDLREEVRSNRSRLRMLERGRADRPEL